MNKLIVWLGNPWDQYVNTKHNIWFVVADKINDLFQWGEFVYSTKFLWDLSTIQYWKYTMFIIKPQTFMNLSWSSVSKIASFYKIDPKNIIVAHDELDLENWQIKFKWNWWDNWHNWLKDITRRIWTNEYRKIKIWIWRPIDRAQVTSWVLGKINPWLMKNLDHKNLDFTKWIKQFLAIS